MNTVQATFRRHPWLLHVVLVLLAGLTWVVLFTGASVPVEVLSAEASPAIVVAGAPVQVHYVVNRYEICPNTITSYWENEDNDPTPILLPIRSRTVPKLGSGLSVYVPDLTAPMQPGRQCYRSQVAHHCPSGDVIVSAPPACITVVPAL